MQRVGSGAFVLLLGLNHAFAQESFEQTLNSVLRFESKQELIDFTSGENKQSFITVKKGSTEQETNAQIKQALYDRGMLNHSGNTIEFGGRQLRGQEKFRSIVQVEGSNTFIVANITITPAGDSPFIAIERDRKIEYNPETKIRQDTFYGMFGKYVPSYKVVRKYGEANQNPPLAPSDKELDAFRNVTGEGVIWANPPYQDSKGKSVPNTVLEALSVGWGCDPSILLRTSNIRKASGGKTQKEIQDSVIAAVTQAPYVEKFYEQGKTSTSEFIVEVDTGTPGKRKFAWGSVRFERGKAPSMKFASSWDFDSSTEQVVITNHDDKSKKEINYVKAQASSNNCLSNMAKQLTSATQIVAHTVQAPLVCIQPTEEKRKAQSSMAQSAPIARVDPVPSPQRQSRTQNIAPGTWKQWFSSCLQAVDYYEGLCTSNKSVGVEAACDFSNGAGNDPRIVVNWNFVPGQSSCEVDFSTLPSKRNVKRTGLDFSPNELTSAARALSGVKVNSLNQRMDTRGVSTANFRVIFQ